MSLKLSILIYSIMRTSRSPYFIISISGNSGSGKSTIAKTLAEKLGENSATRIAGDYYLASNRFNSVNELLQNPIEYDWEFLEKVFENPISTKLTLPQYNFDKFVRITENGGKEFILNKIVIVDAMMPYLKADLTIFVEIDEDERYKRVFNRDQARGSNVMKYWNHHKISMNYLENQNINFDLVLNANESIEKNTEKIIEMFNLSSI